MLYKSENRQSLVALIMGVLFILVGLIFVIGAWGAYFTDTKIEDNGPIALAHIEKKTFLFDIDGDSDYILEYWFTTKTGNVIKASRKVSQSFWQHVREKQTIEIKYSASNPKRNFPIGEGVTSIGMSTITSIFGGLFTIFGSMLTWGYFRNSSKA